MKLSTGIKDRLSTILIVVIGMVGLGLIAYPTFSDWWNSTRQSYVMASYDQAVVEMDQHKYDELIDAAERYNARLAQTGVNWHMTDEEMREYNDLLDVTGTGMMGYIEIPKIHVTLPLYHGTNKAVLQTAIGHIAGTSLPVGGLGSHCSVSGHRGLPSARLFTDVNLLDVGDQFMVTVLDRLYTYEVDQVRIVLPAELRDLAIDPAQDYVTLVTCTPYGINSHRLLVRGHRIDNTPQTMRVLADAVQIKPYLMAIFFAIPVLVGAGFLMGFSAVRRVSHQRAHESTRREFRQRRARREKTERVEGDDVRDEPAGNDARSDHADDNDE